MTYFIFQRTTKTGGYPNISFIARKPELLGIDFKVANDGVCGTLLWIKIQEGKNRMSNKDFYRDLGSTISCVMRGVKFGEKFDLEVCDQDYDTTPTKSDLWLGDSWFGSVKACTNVSKYGHHWCLMIKTVHSRYPKKFLDDKMKEMPGGTWIFLECHSKKK